MTQVTKDSPSSTDGQIVLPRKLDSKMVTFLVGLLVATAGGWISMRSSISTHEVQINAIEKRLERMEAKLDHLLERKP